MMSAHIYFPALEPEGLPVTLSQTVLSGLLRQELGYEGMIVTDCMEMDAIAVNYGTVDAAVMAVEAGADLVLISHTSKLQAEAFEALLAAVESGRISESRIDESVTRLLMYKVKHGLLENELHGAGDEEVISTFSNMSSRIHQRIFHIPARLSATVHYTKRLPAELVRTVLRWYAIS